MAREGTRSQTGNSKPRIFTVIDTAPTRKSTTTTTSTSTSTRAKPKKTKVSATTSNAAIAKGAKPMGITKKKKKGTADVKKEPTLATKPKSVAKMVSTKMTGVVKAGKKEPKPKTAKAKANALAPVAS